MPRGKKKVVNIAEKIEVVKAEIETLTTQLKEKKAEQKKLEAEQAEEDKAKLMEAFVASGKSVDEVMHSPKIPQSNVGNATARNLGQFVA